MIYRILQQAEIVNTVEADELFVAQYCAQNGYTYELEERAESGPEVQLPTLEERVGTLEQSKANQADVDELNEALNMILTGATK